MLFGGRHKEDDTVVEMLASALRRDISFGVLAPDQKLKIEALRQRYGGSHHSIRETLRMLSVEGMVEATSQRGFRVTSASESDRQDILLVRLSFEGMALERSLTLGGIDWEAGVIAAAHRLDRADSMVETVPDDVTALQWDQTCRAFTMALIAACDSPRLLDAAGRYYDQSRRFRLALMREGHLDFAARSARRERLKQSVIARAGETALAALEEDIRAEMGGSGTSVSPQNVTVHIREDRTI